MTEPREQRPVPVEAASQLIEVGWLVAGPLDPVDREAVEEARRKFLGRLRDAFPKFTWSMPLVERGDTLRGQRVEPVSLLEMGEMERETKHWDFALVVTGSDLKSYDKAYTLAVPSRSLGVATLSTSRIDPQAASAGSTREERREAMVRRLVALALHLFGHLNDLDHDEERTSAMFDLRSPRDLDVMDGFSESARELLAEELSDVADLRLEEEHPGQRPNRWAFYLRTVWRNWDDVISSVRQARPWRFPVQLSRLTTAAASGLVILLITAEVWDLGMNQPPHRVIALALGLLSATTTYILLRQRLLVRRGSRRLTEQTAVTHISVTLSVLFGLVTTYAALFAAVLLLAWLVFPQHLVAEWAVSLGGRVALGHYLALAGFVASLGILIGSLGASFEEQQYFRHIAYVDEET